MLNVSIRAPRAGRKATIGMVDPLLVLFQSAPRERGERQCDPSYGRVYPVSIRAPRAGRKIQAQRSSESIRVSIRAPRAGRKLAGRIAT